METERTVILYYPNEQHSCNHKKFSFIGTVYRSTCGQCSFSDKFFNPSENNYNFTRKWKKNDYVSSLRDIEDRDVNIEFFFKQTGKCVEINFQLWNILKFTQNDGRKSRT